MRPIAVGLLIAALCSTNVALAACAVAKPFIEKLNAGADPGAFPDASGCGNEFEADLTTALVAFIEKNPPSKVKVVVATIRDWHRTQQRKSPFESLAKDVAKSLAAKGKTFTLPEATDKYALLDGVHLFAGLTEPATPQVVKPTTPIAAPPQPRLQPPVPKKVPAPPTETLLWIAAITGIVTISLVASLVIATFVFKPNAELVKRLEAVSNGINDLRNAVRASADKADRDHQTFAADLKHFAENLDAQFLKPAHLAPLSASIVDLRREVSVIGSAPAADQVVMPSRSSVVLEREVLAESWKNFCNNKELFAAYENAKQSDGWQQVDALFDGLARYVPDDLKPTLEAVLAPARDYGNLVRRLQLVPRLVSDELPDAGSEAKELLRTRDLAQALAAAHNGGVERLRFRLRAWVTDSFLGFADLFLQHYQQARMENRDAGMEPGVEIVRRVLRVAALEPIDVKLGETPFDSARHVGRSMSSDTRFPDGVITAVVRNGFVEGGQHVIRQPEVIVNRLR